MSPRHPVPADRREAFARARAAIRAETNPAVLRAWGRLFDDVARDAAPGDLSYLPPGCPPELARDLRRIELILLLGAQARA